MNDFKKYRSIENHYNSKMIYKVREQNPELDTEKFIVMEKVDGANLQLVFTPGEEMKVGKRTSYLAKDEPFFDVWNTLKKYTDELRKISIVADETNQEIKVYGELFGKGINDRVCYGPEQYFCIFELYVAGKRQTPAELHEFLDLVECRHLGVPVLKYVDGLINALAENETFKTCAYQMALGFTNQNLFAEGLVIRPYYKNIYLNEDDIFIVKKKDKAFAETEQKDKPNTNLEKYDNTLIELKMKFSDYITRNRLLSVISKIGALESEKQIGQFVVALANDAKDDFMKENAVPYEAKSDQKFIFASGSNKAALMIKSYLMEGN